MQISLSDNQFIELIKIYKTHTKSYVRRRALALIHLHEGLSIRRIARILKVNPNSILNWKKRFTQFGFDGLFMNKRNTRKAAIDRSALLDIIRQSPKNFGVEASRWTLELLHTTIDELNTYTLSGIWRLLRSYGVSWQKGRFQLISPDPDYEKKKQ